MIASPEIPCANSVTGIPKQRRSARKSVSRKTLIGYRDAGGKASTPLWICKPFILCYLYLSQGSKALQILGHELELAFLLQAIVQGFLKRLKSEIALRLQEFIGQLLLLFVEIGQVGFRLFGHAVDEPVLPEAQGGRHIASLEVEGCADLLGAGRAGDRAIARNKVAR